MSNKKTEEATVTDEQAKVVLAARDAVAPVAGQTQKPVDMETLSHQYQAGSPAVNTNVLSEHLMNTGSILEKIDTPENLKAREQAKPSIDFVYEEGDDIDPAKRDVSDPKYAQPGSEKHKAWAAKNK